MKLVIGIDVGGTTAKFGLFTQEGALLGESSLPTGKDKGVATIMQEIAQQVDKILQDQGLAREELLGIGLGVPGPVLNASILNGAVNLNWGLTPIVDLLHAQGLDYPIFAENDANVAALGENWKGAAEAYQSIVFVTVGTGIGGGIIHKGEIISGKRGAGGEIGHMPILSQPLDFACGCGGHHCLEQVASAPNIVRYAKELLAKRTEASALDPYNGAFDTRAIFSAADKGDKLSLQVIQDVCEVFGRGLAILGAAFDPEAFVLGGGVSNAGQSLLKPLRKAYQKYAFPVTRDIPILQASLGNKAGMYGAAQLVLRSLGE